MILFFCEFLDCWLGNPSLIACERINHIPDARVERFSEDSVESFRYRYDLGVRSDAYSNTGSFCLAESSSYFEVCDAVVDEG